MVYGNTYQLQSWVLIFFLQGNIAFLCNFKIKIDQTDINPNFGVSNTNKVTAWHRINNYCQLLNYVQDPLVFKCTQTSLSSSLMLQLTQARQWVSYISSIFKSNRERFLCLHSLADRTQEGFGEFKTVMVL